jgi:hypothetical protein
MLGRAFLSGLFYQALVIATPQGCFLRGALHRLKQAKTKNHRFGNGKRSIEGRLAAITGQWLCQYQD